MPKRLTIDDIYDPERKVYFDGTAFPEPIWLDNAHFLLRKTDPKTQRTEWLKIDAETGESSRFYDSDMMKRALAQLDGMSDETASRLSSSSTYVLNPERSAILLNHANDLFYYRFGSDELVRLTATASAESSEEFSPDGHAISFIRDNNLFVMLKDSHVEVRLTADGNEKVLNGRLDWVYQEEIYGRENFKGYWWSPDSRKIAYLRLDENALKPFPVTDHVAVSPDLEITNYPLAGQPNPSAQLGVVDVQSGLTTWLDLSKYNPEDMLIVRVGWTPDSARVVYQVQDRRQRWLALNVGNKTIIHEQRDAWVGVTGEPKWLKDGSLLWISERSGWAHLYHYSAQGEMIRQITDGAWEVRSLLAVDEESGLLYFSGTRDGHTANQTFRARIDASGSERLTSSAGTHRSFFNPTATQFVDYWSDFNIPTQIRLHSSDGRVIRTVDENHVAALAEFDPGVVEFRQIPTRDGFAMESLLIRPSDFDPAMRYPVMVYTYGGPHHPQVVQAWGGERQMWHRLLAQMGYIVWICDNRTASGKGAESTWPLYRETGKLELSDIEDGVRWLKSQSYVDADRIGIWGWSYGGYMTLYALTHSSLFKLGIAGAPVTDWRNYDSIYTERFMSTPQDNPEGYEQSSVVKSAANLNGKLLLIHGATDDNVHLQNTMQFAYELQKAGKPFEMMVYPRTRHAVTDPAQLKHLRTLMTEFIVRNL